MPTGCRQAESVAPVERSVEQTASPIRVLAWNIESDGANPDVIGGQLKAMPSYDLYAFSEVRANETYALTEALGEDYQFLLSQSGNDDRLAYAISKKRFEIIDKFELDRFEELVINPGNVRSAFVIELTDKVSEKNLFVMVNHLARGKAEVRLRQAIAIRDWAAAQSKPILAVGDYNFDFEFDTEKGNQAFDAFLEKDVFHWIRPDPMVDSNYDDRNGDGIDDYEGSLLDFAFTANEATRWTQTCRVVVRPGDFPDDKTTSDHRPVEVLLTP